MDYSKVYNQIIKRAQTRTLEGYGENHHIIPKCMGGIDKDNIVRLTAREHFLCHLLLCEIHPNNTNLSRALFLMSTNKNKKQYQRYKVSSRMYEYLKQTFINHTTGLSKPDGFGEKISSLLKKRNIDWETRNKKASDKLKGRKITWNLKGIKRSSDILGKPIAIQQYTLDGVLINEYKSIAEAANGSKSLHESIRCNIKGKYKTAGGFIWKRNIS